MVPMSPVSGSSSLVHRPPLQSGVAALDENLLYDELGVNAEYLIDHAFGREPTTIADIQAYRPQATSTTTGQVLSKGYAYEQAYTVLREMVDNAVLDLVDKHVVCDSISLFVGYASERADIRRLDASGTAQYVDGCGHLRSSTSGIEPTATAGPELAPRAPKPVQRDDERSLPAARYSSSPNLTQALSRY